MTFLRIFLGIFFISTYASFLFGQDLRSDAWDCGSWNPKSSAIWPLHAPTESDSIPRLLELAGFGTLQYSPGAQLRGPWWNWPSAGGTGWQLGLTWDWKHDRWQGSGLIEHWRVAGVNATDWNEAWQWGTWDGLGWAWNPNQADIALLRAIGSIRYQVSPSVSLEAGNRQHHWGHGWRSLWMDRQAAPLPFARLNLRTERLQYVHMVARTTHRSVGSPPDFPGSGQFSPGTYVNKRGSWLAAHTVTVDFGRGWEGGLFGAVTWLANDSGYTDRFEGVYALPVIAFRPAEYALGSADNALIGASLAHVPRWGNGRLRLYSQLLLDELVVSELFDPSQWWANKWGLLGSLTWKSSNEEWTAVLEACAVRPYTYAHTATAQSWTHNRQPLAHPAGSNFAEGRAHVRWDRAPWHAHLGMVLRRQGIDELVELDKIPAFSIGADPLLSYSSRPADYGVGLMWDGNGLAGDTDVVDQRLGWLDLGYDIPQLQDQQVFIRAMQNKRLGQRTDENWWRVELGIRLNRVLEERNW